MTISYALTADDYLVNNLYGSSKSDLHNKRRFRSRVIIPLLYFVFALFSYFSNGNEKMALIFGCVAILWFALYPRYSKWRYKNHFKKTIKESYKNRIGQTVSVEFKENNLFSKDLTSETSIDYIEFKDLVNLRDHYLLRLQNDLTIVIPKHAIEDVSFLPTLFDQLGKPVVDEINWVWK